MQSHPPTSSSLPIPSEEFVKQLVYESQLLPQVLNAASLTTFAVDRIDCVETYKCIFQIITTSIHFCVSAHYAFTDREAVGKILLFDRTFQNHPPACAFRSAGNSQC